MPWASPTCSSRSPTPRTSPRQARSPWADPTKRLRPRQEAPPTAQKLVIVFQLCALGAPGESCPSPSVTSPGVRALGYHANIIAQGLKKRSSRTVALIVPDISNPFFPAIARGIEDTARHHGYAVFLCNTYEDLARENAYLALLRTRWVAGGIFATVGSNTRRLRALRRARLPGVLVARGVEGVSIDTVRGDNYRGEYEATMHL